MLDAFQLGGWGMFPTLLVGLCTLWASIQYARRNESKQLSLLALLSLLTLAMGGLGFITGFMKTLEYASEHPDALKLAFAGTFESLHNIALALSFISLSGIVAAIGSWRANRTETVPSRIPVTQ
jgi:uncharacterized membrane protein YesL